VSHSRSGSGPSVVDDDDLPIPTQLNGLRLLSMDEDDEEAVLAAQSPCGQVNSGFA
jgi:hypothetical protein